jgi:hypothetical protein
MQVPHGPAVQHLSDRHLVDHRVLRVRAQDDALHAQFRDELAVRTALLRRQAVPALLQQGVRSPAAELGVVAVLTDVGAQRAVEAIGGQQLAAERRVGLALVQLPPGVVVRRIRLHRPELGLYVMLRLVGGPDAVAEAAAGDRENEDGDQHDAQP